MEEFENNDYNPLYALNDLSNHAETIALPRMLQKDAKGSYTISSFSVENTIEFYIQAFEYILKRISFADEARIRISNKDEEAQARYDFVLHLTEMHKVLDILIAELNQPQSDKERAALGDFYKWFSGIRAMSSMFLSTMGISYKEKIEELSNGVLKILIEHQAANLAQIAKDINMQRKGDYSKVV